MGAVNTSLPALVKVWTRCRVETFSQRKREFCPVMAAYHKPKMFRSMEGCCICKAKSSSSRFTDSGKYENSFKSCFRLNCSRSGDICNACVLIVKRWRNLPQDTQKNWAHVVNSRCGPGNKISSLKVKKTEEASQTVEKFEKSEEKRKVI